MEISIGITPGPDAVRHAQLAEKLGFRRAWLYDSAALYEDIWINIANILNATENLDVGTAVLVPNLRHVMTTASAIATIERMAPGRLVVGFGTGFTARMVLGKKALWQKFSSELRVDPSAFQRATGWVPQVCPRDGLRHAAAALLR